eukprot:2602719-Alexandrium_andersonii.AAC.1
MGYKRNVARAHALSKHDRHEGRGNTCEQALVLREDVHTTPRSVHIPCSGAAWFKQSSCSGPTMLSYDDW